MGKALPFPMHKHPPRGAGLLSKVGSAASQATSAVGEDQGAPGEGTPGEEGATGEEAAGAGEAAPDPAPTSDGAPDGGDS